MDCELQVRAKQTFSFPSYFKSLCFSQQQNQTRTLSSNYMRIKAF